MRPPDAAGLKALDRDHYLHPFTDFKALGDENSRLITAADGIYIEDDGGRRFLDAMAGLWCVNLGYGRQELVDAASRQLQQLPYCNSFFNTTNPPAAALAETARRLQARGATITATKETST